MHNNTTINKQQTYELVENNGITTLKFSCWHDFFLYVNNGMGKYDSDLIWRGQADSKWEIVSSIKRQKNDVHKHLVNFKNAISGMTATTFKIENGEENAERERLKLWALGQHFGLITPLIDWTQFPFIAVFFAFCEETSTNYPQEYRAIYALNMNLVHGKNYEILYEGDMGMECFTQNIKHPPYSDNFIENIILRFDGNLYDSIKDQLRQTKSLPKYVIDQLTKWQLNLLTKKTLMFYTPESNENYRVYNQGGLFCHLPEEIKSVEEWVRNPPKTQVDNGILRKFLVPNSDRNEILKALNKMRINYLSLFPDFEGAAKYCNMAIKERNRSIGCIRPY